MVPTIRRTHPWTSNSFASTSPTASPPSPSTAPPVNAQNRRTREELIYVFDTISDRDDVRVAILTGAGKMFSAGADLKERVGMVHEPGDYVRHNRLVREFFYAVTDCSKPVIAAVNGPALGAGFVLMLACDIMLACEEAYFSMPEINVGLAGGARFLMEQVGRSKTRSIYFTGRRVPAAELYRLGVIEACPPRDKLMEAALDIAREIAVEEPARRRQDQAHAQRHRGNAGARRLSLRAIGDGRAVAHRRRARGTARLRREAQAGVQGPLTCGRTRG